MSNRWKTALGIATAWPLIYVVLYFLFAFWVFFSTAGGGEVPSDVAAAQSVASVLTILTVLLTVGLVVGYVALIIGDASQSSSQKIAWVIVVVTGSIAGMLIYWYLHLKQESEEQLGVLGLGFRLAAEQKAKEAKAAEQAALEAEAAQREERDIAEARPM